MLVSRYPLSWSQVHIDELTSGGRSGVRLTHMPTGVTVVRLNRKRSCDAKGTAFMWLQTKLNLLTDCALSPSVANLEPPPVVHQLEHAEPEIRVFEPEESAPIRQVGCNRLSRLAHWARLPPVRVGRRFTTRRMSYS